MMLVDILQNMEDWIHPIFIDLAYPFHNYWLINAENIQQNKIKQRSDASAQALTANKLGYIFFPCKANLLYFLLFTDIWDVCDTKLWLWPKTIKRGRKKAP